MGLTESQNHESPWLCVYVAVEKDIITPGPPEFILVPQKLKAFGSGQWVDPCQKQ